MRGTRRGSLLLVMAATVALVLPVPVVRAADDPPTPIDFHATQVEWNFVDLAWTPPLPDLNGWHWVYEITNLETGWTEHAGHFETSRRWGGLQPDTQYSFEIRLLDFSRGVASAPSDPVTVTTPPMPAVAPPANLRVDAAYSFTSHLSWDPSPDPGVQYRVRAVEPANMAGGLTTGTSWSLRYAGQEPGRTYTYEVIAIRSDGAESEPSNVVSVTTVPVAPPTDVTTQRNGNDVTLSWTAPEGVDPAIGATYLIYDGGVLQRQVSSAQQIVETTLARTESGVTHNYTVALRHNLSVAFGIVNTSGPSAVTSVAVPPADDTTPPTAPEAVIVWEEDDYGIPFATFMVTTESTDDITPQAEIRYEALRGGITGELFVYNENHPLVLPETFGPLPDRGIRAVDEAGNRSQIVIPACDDSRLSFRQC